MTTSFEDEALTVLRRALGPSAEFRDGQLEAISGLVEQRSRLLVVQRTGWGKSAVYFVATRLLRDRGAGTTIIVSPLLALMRDQIGAASRLHLNAVTINSSNTEEWERIENDLLAGRSISCWSRRSDSTTPTSEADCSVRSAAVPVFS